MERKILLPKNKKIRDRSHLDFLSYLPCIKCPTKKGWDHWDRSDPAHIRIDGEAGMGQKPDDSRAVPLCHGHHLEQHLVGERTFWGDKLQAAIDLSGALYVKTRDLTHCIMMCNRFPR